MHLRFHEKFLSFLYVVYSIREYILVIAGSEQKIE